MQQALNLLVNNPLQKYFQSPFQMSKKGDTCPMFAIHNMHLMPLHIGFWLMLNPGFGGYFLSDHHDSLCTLLLRDYSAECFDNQEYFQTIPMTLCTHKKRFGGHTHLA